MIILSVDHGTRSGFSVFEDASYITSGTISLKNVESLCDCYSKFFELFSIHRPEYVIIEKINVSGVKFGGDNVVKLARLQGVIVMLAQAFNCDVVEVNPMSMKKYIVGNGRAEKQDVAKVVADKFNLIQEHICVPKYYKKKSGIKSYEADESDAIALGVYAIENIIQPKEIVYG